MMEGLQRGLQCSMCGHEQSTSKYLMMQADQLEQWCRALDGEPLARGLEFVARGMTNTVAKLRMSATIQDWEPGTTLHEGRPSREKLIGNILHWRTKSNNADRLIEFLEGKIKRLEIALDDIHDIEC